MACSGVSSAPPASGLSPGALFPAGGGHFVRQPSGSPGAAGFTRTAFPECTAAESPHAGLRPQERDAGRDQLTG